MTRGMMYFPRMLDKIRLHVRGELHEDYHKNLGTPQTLDSSCCNFLRMQLSTISASVCCRVELTKKSLNGVFKAAVSRMKATSLSGMDSYRNSDGAIL